MGGLTNKGHNVEFIEDSYELGDPKKSKLSKEYSYTFDKLEHLLVSMYTT